MEKKTVQDYIDIINQKKWDAHNIQWLYICLLYTSQAAVK